MEGERVRKQYNARGGEWDRACIEINLDNLAHNVRELVRAMPAGCELMAVVKAEAYGHGALPVCAHLNRIGVKAFAVATIDEAIRLRTGGIRGEILILGYTDVRRAAELARYRLTQTLIDYAYAKELDACSVPVRAHLKIDTGMHRLGIESGETMQVLHVFAMKNLRVCGMYTHLCCADSLAADDVAFTRKQIARFYRLADHLKANGVAVPKLHIQSSYGLLNYPGLQCDYVRAGVALYGVPSRPGERTIRQLDLRPVLSLKTKVVLLRNVKRGASVGYNRCFTAKRDSRVAILPVGYADGLPRALSCGTGNVVIGKKRLPVIGRVCMDQMAVDVTDAEEIAVGDPVTLIGAKDDGISAPVVADCCGSITNELLSRLGARLPVVARVFQE